MQLSVVSKKHIHGEIKVSEPTHKANDSCKQASSAILIATKVGLKPN